MENRVFEQRREIGAVQRNLEIVLLLFSYFGALRR